MRLWVIALVAVVFVVVPALAGSKYAKWDDEASRRKADYIFLEAGHQKALDANDAYFDLLKRALQENPDDKMLEFSYGFYQTLVGGTDSYTIAKGFRRLQQTVHPHAAAVTTRA